MLIHRSGPLPQNLPSRSAISGETPACSDKIRCTCWRVTRRCRATSVTLIPSAGNTVSLRTAPGCVGADWDDLRRVPEPCEIHLLLVTRVGTRDACARPNSVILLVVDPCASVYRFSRSFRPQPHRVAHLLCIVTLQVTIALIEGHSQARKCTSQSHRSQQHRPWRRISG